MDKSGHHTRQLRRTAQLSTGEICTEHHAGIDSNALYGFGERINPRRSFVFVSRVLGRHIPVRPSTARHAFSSLADQLPVDLPGPVVITSMAETAVGLGAGVHDAYIKRTGRQDILNYSSTRTARPQGVFGHFSEAHSHASGHTLYVPAMAHDQVLLNTSRTLVMVDDEASSGNTFRALAKTLHNAGLDRFERVFALTLTDWSSDVISIESQAVESGQIQAERCSLLSGSYSWTALPDAPVMVLPDPDVPARLAQTPVFRQGDARVGNSGITSTIVPEKLLRNMARNQEDTRPVLILGTGEHVWEPFLLAQALEKQRVDVRFSATTRSPILIGHDISCAFTFSDHEALGIRNYLYNVDPQQYSLIVICIDTAIESLDITLVNALHADVLFCDEYMTYEELASMSANTLCSVMTRPDSAASTMKQSDVSSTVTATGKNA